VAFWAKRLSIIIGGRTEVLSFLIQKEWGEGCTWGNGCGKLLLEERRFAQAGSVSAQIPCRAGQRSGYPSKILQYAGLYMGRKTPGGFPPLGLPHLDALVMHGPWQFNPNLSRDMREHLLHPLVIYSKLFPIWLIYFMFEHPTS